SSPHAEILGNNSGLVTVEKTFGQQSYTGSTRNGVTTIIELGWIICILWFKTQFPKPPIVPTQKPSVQCPSDCTVNGRNVWGTDVYTDDSSICKAAIHAGILGNTGGLVTVEKSPGQQSYTGSTRNGVTTNNYGAWSGSFVFHASSKPPTPKPTIVPTQKPPGSLLVQCPSDCTVNGRNVWGTDVYTDDSSICKAAIHAGILGNTGGLVTVEKSPGQQSYTGSTRNGVTTNNYGAWSGSFVLHASSKPPTPKPTIVPTQKPPGSLLSNIIHNYNCTVSGRNVWGTDVYTDDSSFCKAAIHAGILGNNGGLVTVEKTPGLSSYTGSTRNGVTTNYYGSWTGSFVLHCSSKPPTPKPTKIPTKKPPEYKISYHLSPVLPHKDSSICKAAIHAGILENDGGLVAVKKIPGQSSYSGSSRNGITSNNYGSFSGSFIFHNLEEPETTESTDEQAQLIELVLG
ncbi:hypothetical protein AB205_0005830, partial [Aquarana catesbeiana]